MLRRGPHPRGCTAEPRPVPPLSSLPADLQWARPDHGLALCGDLCGQLVREGEVSVMGQEGGWRLGGWAGGSLVAPDVISGSKIRNLPPSCFHRPRYTCFSD